MICEFCGKEVKVWWVKDEKWCCKECKKEDLKERNDKIFVTNELKHKYLNNKEL